MGSYVGYRDGAGTTNEQGLHQELNKLFTKGVSLVHSATSLAVSQRAAGANVSVDVAAGDAHIVRPDGLYGYWGWTDAVTNVAVSASNPSNPRIDAVVVYVDLSVTSGTNNPGALKFKAIPGTAAASPTAPADSAIQSNLGTGVPWLRIAQISVAASSSNVVTANITDFRQPVAAKSRLWGGSNNSKGHTVPNVADDTVVLSNAANLAANSVTADKMLGVDLLGVTGQISAGTVPPAGSGQFYIQAGSTVGTFSLNALDIAFPTPFPNGLLTVLVSNGDVSEDNQPMTVSNGSNSATGFRAQSYNGQQRVNWIAIGW